MSKPKEPTEAQKAAQYKPGQSGNPLGRPPLSAKAASSKRLARALQLLMLSDCPDQWLDGVLEPYKGHGLRIEEAVVLKAAHALVTGVRYANSSLLNDVINRLEGKVVLRVLTKPAEENDDYSQMSETELDMAIQDLVGRAREAQAQLPEGEPIPVELTSQPLPEQNFGEPAFSTTPQPVPDDEAL